ncbi:MFS transporter [Devosia sp.]|uniref:MFS transporter n=1 Tax=Devosia sp. TaxID=1871048 RepID=UPI0019DF6CBC|nr:MFS transporter [Devosia sp.]MBE0580836.1 MFS transporter [Devosia sp.]
MTISADAVDTPDQTSRPGTFTALRYRNYRLFWYGNAISFIGDWLDQIALSWLVISTTNDPVMLGLVNLGRGLPIMLFALFGGVIADRVNRRTMLICTQLLAMTVAIGLACTVAFFDASIWLIMALATCRGLIVAFNLPARHSLVYQLVPREAMASAVSINSITINMAKIIGPLASAAIISTLGITACFIANALSFTAVMVMLLQLDLPDQKVERKAESLLASLVGGFTYMKSEPVLLMLVAVALVPTFFCQPYIQFLAVFSAQVFDAGASGLGLMTALAAAGSIYGGLLASRLQRDVRRGSTMLVFMGGFGLALILFSAAPSIYWAIPVLFAAGAMHIAYNSSNNTILQLAVDDAYRGRVLSSLFMTRGLMPLGTAAMALLSVPLGPRLAMGMMASVVVVFAIVLWFWMPRLRTLKA